MQVALQQIEQGIAEQDTPESNGIVCHDRYLEVLPSATYETVASTLQRFMLIEDDLPFYTGRLMRELRDRFGKSLEDIALLCGMKDKQTVKDRMSVDNRIPLENRNFSRRVKYSHYRYVAPLSHEEQRKWLTMADEECIGANTLLSMIQLSQGKNKPLQFDRPNKSDIEPLAALGSADGGSDYLVDRQDEAKSSHGNYSRNGHVSFDYGESDLSYAIGHKADELGRESDLEGDIEVIRQERDRAVMEWRDMRHTIASLQEAMADLQENHRKAVLRLGSEKEQLQAKLEAIGGNLYQVLESNHLAYDLYLLDALKRDGLIDNSQYDNLKALRNDASFDEDVKETVYVDEEF